MYTIDNQGAKKMKISELAKKYGTTTEEIRRSINSFAMNEGYLSDGTECETLQEWFEKTINPVIKIETEPFQKSDLNYGL
jgi:hypothetical protein